MPDLFEATLRPAQRLKATLTVPQRFQVRLAETVPIPGPPGPQGEPGPSASVLQYKADANSQLKQDPGAGKIRWNAVPQTAATALYVDVLTDNDFDASLVLRLTGVESRFAIQDADTSENYQVWDRAAPVIEYPGWFEVPVTFVKSSGAGAFAHNSSIAVLVQNKGQQTTIENEGVALESPQPILNFAGAGVNAAVDGERITVTIPGGSLAALGELTPDEVRALVAFVKAGFKQ